MHNFLRRNINTKKTEKTNISISKTKFTNDSLTSNLSLMRCQFLLNHKQIISFELFDFTVKSNFDIATKKHVRYTFFTLNPLYRTCNRYFSISLRQHTYLLCTEHPLTPPRNIRF